MYYRQNERRGQKQNGQDNQSFKLKTRQYSNFIANPITQNNLESNRQIEDSNKSINLLLNSYTISDSFQKQSKLNYKARTNEGSLRQSPKPLGICNNYRPDRSELGRFMKPSAIQSYDYKGYTPKQNKSKSPIQKDYIQNSYSQNNKIGQTICNSQSFKKENARQKGFQMKMNNIDSISDQINSLLNMVRKDRSNNDHSTSKSPTKFRQTSTIRNQSHKPTTTNRVSQFDPKDKQIDRKYDQYSHCNYNDQQRRTRICSALGTKEINNVNKSKYFQLDPYQKKQTEKLNIYQNLNKQRQNERTMKYQINLQNKETLIKNVQNNIYRTSYSPNNVERSNRYQEKVSTPNNQHLKGKISEKYYQPKISQDSVNSPCIQQSNFWKYQQEDTFKSKKQLGNYTPKYKRQASREKNDNYYLPLTLQSPKQQSFPTGYQNYGLDEQIKRIKDRIKQSQHDNHKMQQKYQVTQPNHNFHNNYDRNTSNNYDQKAAGQLYKKNSISPAKHFQIKVHPVPIDKPMTINIAQKLSKQIELDRELKFHRCIFANQMNQSKWQYLEQSLREKGLALSIFQIKFLIEMSKRQLQQISPKQSFKRDTDIVDIIYKAQIHWESEVYGCANSRALNSENFKIESFDTLRKGYLSDQDIVQFINQYTGKNYREEDVTLIFRRLQLLEGNNNEEKLKYSTFIKAICL